MSNQPADNPNPYNWNANSSPTTPQMPPSMETGDGTGGVIPYKNPKALIAYYLGIFSGFPLIGIPLGIAAFILGIKGLKARKENPAIKGSVHAWIGIGCGGFFALLWSALCVLMVIGIVIGSQKR